MRSPVPITAGMELFASCLWHLRCDVELSVLTEAMLNSDPSRVEGVCAKATSLNLSRDHDGAIKCLQRAVSVSVCVMCDDDVCVCVMLCV